MGASNVKAVYAHWGHLTDPAFRLLVFIALITRDEDRPPSFWGGHESLAVGLGRKPPHDSADLRAVGRAMTLLRTAGALKRVAHSAPGRTARHELVLDPTPDARRPVSSINTGRRATGEHRTPGVHNTGRPTTEHRTSHDRTPDVGRPTEEEQDQKEVTEDHTTPPIPAPHPYARTRACGNRMPIAADGTCGCAEHFDQAAGQ